MGSFGGKRRDLHMGDTGLGQALISSENGPLPALVGARSGAITSLLNSELNEVISACPALRAAVLAIVRNKRDSAGDLE